MRPSGLSRLKIFFVFLKMICTLASASSCSVLIPNRGRALVVRLELCVSFFTPLIWHMGFSRSRSVGDGISTSFCLSEEHNTELSDKDESELRGNNLSAEKMELHGVNE